MYDSRHSAEELVLLLLASVSKTGPQPGQEVLRTMHSVDAALWVWKICSAVGMSRVIFREQLFEGKVAPMKEVRSLNQKQTATPDLQVNLD